MILHIETSGVNCSVALSNEGILLAEQTENAGRFTHSEHLHLFITTVMQQAGITFSELKAIAVSAGAGSYTGLRIGIATAKGLCFALNIPLIAIPTLQIIAAQAPHNPIIIPMIDARRMEVYSAVLNEKYTFIASTQSVILNEESYSEYLAQGKVVFLGDGSDKFAAICKHPNALFISGVFPQAKDMIPFATEKYKLQSFENTAYFEPQYLK